MSFKPLAFYSAAFLYVRILPIFPNTVNYIGKFQYLPTFRDIDYNLSCPMQKLGCYI